MPKIRKINTLSSVSAHAWEDSLFPSLPFIELYYCNIF